MYFYPYSPRFSSFVFSLLKIVFSQFKCLLRSGQAAQVTPLCPQLSRPRSSDAFTSPISSGSRVSIRVCDWLSATFPSSHWSMESQSAGVGDRNSSGSLARLVPCPHSQQPPTCSYSVSTSPISPTLSSVTRQQAGGSDLRLRRLNEIFEAGAEQMWRERVIVEMLYNIIIQYPSSGVSALWKLNRAADYFTFDTSEYFSFREIPRYIFWGKITSSDYLSQYSVSVSF